jgi:hypothetical protein
VIHPIEICRVAIVGAQIIKPEQKTRIVNGHCAAQVYLVALTHKLRIVRRALRVEQRPKGRYPKRARDVDALRVRAGIVVVETRATVIRDLAGPEIESTFVRLRLGGQKIRVMRPYKKPLVIDRVRRPRYADVPDKSIRRKTVIGCPCGS